jgi:hypothetical protein
MTFDERRVFTALTAGVLEPGDKVFVANNIEDLKSLVACGDYDKLFEINRIMSGCVSERFEVKYNGSFKYFQLAYLIKEYDGLRWTDLELGDVIKNGKATFIVTGIDPDDPQHRISGPYGGLGLSDDALRNWTKCNYHFVKVVDKE